MSASKNFLIVGAGIAGMSIVKHLEDNGQCITIVDNGLNKSSLVAAGMINPLVFRRMTKSWRVDEFLPFCDTFYRQIEQLTAQRFYHQITIRRIFSSLQERKFWEEKQHHVDYKHYMEVLTDDDYGFKGANNPFGTGRVKGSAFVEAECFIHAFLKYLRAKHQLLNEAFDYSCFNPEGLSYRGKTYDGVIFCEGFMQFNNPLFQYLPIQSTKGETIIIDCPELQTTESLNRKCFVLPLGEKQYLVGATYRWNSPDDQLTEEGTTELMEKFKVVSSANFVISGQKAGIRPTTPDRRPIMGAHPKYKNIFIFNGLGTKGYMSAPLLAYELCELILKDKALSHEVSLNRFKKS